MAAVDADVNDGQQVSMDGHGEDQRNPERVKSNFQSSTGVRTLLASRRRLIRHVDICPSTQHLNKE